MSTEFPSVPRTAAQPIHNPFVEIVCAKARKQESIGAVGVTTTLIAVLTLLKQFELFLATT
ncbi:hypothetical protein D3C87_1295510 [compost metagenome]